MSKFLNCKYDYMAYYKLNAFLAKFYRSDSFTLSKTTTSSNVKCLLANILLRTCIIL